jgi:hypothetical protein
MRTKLFQTIFKSALAVLATLALLGMPRLFGTFQSSVDLPRLYAEISGDYEFYFGQRYWILLVTTDQGKLWGKNPGESPREELRPVDIAGLKFKIEDPSKAPGHEQYIVFVRNPDGPISGLRLPKARNPPA